MAAEWWGRKRFRSLACYTPVPMGDGEGERSGPRFPEWECPGWRKSYLVDPASSHMLVSKIKPCMCKYKLFCTVKLRMAH
jgi:hypothetical protein